MQTNEKPFSRCFPHRLGLRGVDWRVFSHVLAHPVHSPQRRGCYAFEPRGPRSPTSTNRGAQNALRGLLRLPGIGRDFIDELFHADSYGEYIPGLSRGCFPDGM